MDLLTDLLHQAGLRRRLLDLRTIADTDAVRFPCEKSLGLHVVTQGALYLHAPALPQPLCLRAGDIAVMARGCTHILSGQARLTPAQSLTETGFAPSVPGAEAPVQGGSNALISGAYQLWNAPLHPFLRDIPGWVVLRADDNPRLGPLALMLGLMNDELQQRAAGVDTVVHGLLDVVFTYVLRELLRRQADSATCSWGHAMADQPVRQAIALMHADCARAWTLESLARQAGLSRTGLAERFREAMGDTPLSYLRTVRMQKAMALLGETGRNLEQVAREVGYTDAFSFSKVFKREVGISPREFRRRDEADKQSGWRIQGT
jgi:AraC-like DNA-binding protein